MKIIFHFRVRGTGAEGVHIAGMAGALQNKGHQIVFVSPTAINPIEALSAQKEQPQLVSSFSTRLLHSLADRLPQPLFELMEMAYSRLAFQRLQKAIAQEKPGLIYERHAFFNLAGCLAAEKARIPLILEVNELSGLERVRGQFFQRTAARRQNRALRGAALVSTVSPLLSRMAATARGSEQGIVTIQNGVFREWVEASFCEQERARLRAELGLPADAIILGFVGGLVAWHGFDFLLDAFQRLLPEQPKLHLLIIGQGPLMPQLQASAGSPAMQGRVKLIGARPYRQTRACLDLFDLAIIPHANEFRSPIKLFEYMGAGRAIIAPSAEPIAEVIQDGRDGLLFKPLDVTGALAALRMALSRPELRAELGSNARQKALSSCLWEHRAKRLLNAARQTGVSV